MIASCLRRCKIQADLVLPSQVYLKELRNIGDRIEMGAVSADSIFNPSVSSSSGTQDTSMQIDWKFTQGPFRRPSRTYLWPVDESDSTDKDDFAFKHTGIFPEIDEIVHFLEYEKLVNILPIDLTINNRRDVGEWAIIGTTQSAGHAKRVGNLIRKHIQSLKLENIVCFVNAIPNQEWIVVRMGPVILHLMTKDDRALYALEDMYLQSSTYHHILSSVLLTETEDKLI